MRRAKITALGTYTPPKVLTNQDLEKIVETSDQWILDRTGISERHIVAEGQATSDMAVEAAKQALVHRGVGANTVDLIILATVTPDMFFPSTACLVQARIGAKGAWGFDILAACSGFVYALSTGAQFIANGAAKRVLVIGADAMSRIIDYTDRATCVLFGDGAGAVLLEPTDGDTGDGFLDYLNEIDGSGGAFLSMPGGGSLHPSTEETVKKRMHYVHQDGRQVFKYATRKMYETSVPVAATQRADRQRRGRGLAASGQQAHHHGVHGTHGDRSGQSVDQHRPFRQHHRRNDSAGHARCHGSGFAEEGQPGAAVRGRRWVYRGYGAGALELGVRKEGKKQPPMNADKSGVVIGVHRRSSAVAFFRNFRRDAVCFDHASQPY